MALTPTNKNLSKRVKDIKLNSLLEITKAINNNFSTEQLLEIFEEVLEKQLNIGKLVLFSNENDSWKCILKYGVGDEYNDINVERDLLSIKEIGTINFSQKRLSKAFEIVIPVFHKLQPLAYVLIGDLEDKVEVSPAIKHLPFVQTLTSIIVVAIENKKLARDTIRQAAMRKELELASEMQSMLFPSTLPKDKNIDTAAFYLPHQQVGGDYYDFIWLNENECAFCVADVSGKGVAAALLMSNFQANLRVLFHHTSTLTELVRELNSKVMANAKGEKFITLFIAKYNLITRTLTYVNAAHNPPLIASGNSISTLKIGCTGLGMFDEIDKIKEGIVNISPGTTIVCYTDGLTELENDKGEDFGIDSLKDLIKNNPKLNMMELNVRIMETVMNYKQSRPYIDDIALFSIKVF
ncbi:MAG TPA: PP2C family protein-serine/threonine phosphatase [Bacteroidia bacterium]|nr:PP2C family protein-serine/threonine phosphatase [Bacteroidia bacterium]